MSGVLPTGVLTEPQSLPALRASFTHSDLYREARRALEAIRLIELGARATLVRQLTGLEKTVVNRLFRQCNGRASPPGLLPFTESWYRQNERRMLHAAVIWQLYRRLRSSGRSAARVLIDVYEGYLSLVREPLLCLTRAAFVPRLVGIAAWRETACRECGSLFLLPMTNRRGACPGCQRYRRLRGRRPSKATGAAGGATPAARAPAAAPGPAA